MNKYSIAIYNGGKEEFCGTIYANDDAAAVRNAIAQTGKKRADIVIVNAPDGTCRMDNVSLDDLAM